MRRLLTALLTASFASLAMTGPTTAADMQHLQAPAVASANVPACDDADVLAEVEDQFEYGAPRVLETKLEILEFSGMIETGYFPQRLDDPLPSSPIERRYCQATALISDGKHRTVYYVIEHPMGFAAAGGHLGRFSPVKSWRAEGCVLGLDEWHVYGADCQSLRRFPAAGRTGPGYVTK